jgi:hypothetical protein
MGPSPERFRGSPPAAPAQTRDIRARIRDMAANASGASWSNMVERLFGELDQKQLKRLASNGVVEPLPAVTRHTDNRNTDPKAFVWTKSAQEIIKKI